MKNSSDSHPLLPGHAWLSKGRYSVSPCGYVWSYRIRNRSVDKPRSVPFRISTENQKSNRYFQVTVDIGEGRKCYTVHRLVGIAFLKKAAADKVLVCHKDGNAKNNKVSNLYWGSDSDNQLDRNKHGTSSRETHTKLSLDEAKEVITLLRDGFNARALASAYNVSATTIRGVRDGNTGVAREALKNWRGEK